MGAGALIQVALRGKEDAYFTSSTSPSVWRAMYHKTANFARETVPIPFRQEVHPGNSATCIIDRIGDLLCGLTLEVTATKLPDRFAGAFFPTEALVKDAEVRINGEVYDRHDGAWMRLFDTLHRSYDEAQRYMRVANFDPALINAETPVSQTLYLPLSFSFCQHASCAIPMVALANAEVALHVNLNPPDVAGLAEGGFQMRVLAHFAYIDHAERLELVRKPIDVLVEQVQVQRFTLPDDVPSTTGVTNYHAKLGFYRPVKSMYWFLTNETYQHGRFFGDSANITLALTPHPATPSGLALVEPVPEYVGPVLSARLVMDGQELMKVQPGAFFNKLMPFQSYRGHPLPGVYTLSFARNLEHPAVSGFCNFTPLTDVRLELAFKQSSTVYDGQETTGVGIDAFGTLVVMAWSYNVLHVENGSCNIVFL